MITTNLMAHHESKLGINDYNNETYIPNSISQQHFSTKSKVIVDQVIH